jgi:hypothetical protein
MLRAPWRLTLFIVIALVATQVAGALIYSVLPTVGQLLGMRLILFGWVSVAGLLLAHEVCLRRVDKLPWKAAALDRGAARPRRLVEGALIGALAIGVPSLLLAAVGWLDVQPQPDGSVAGEGARALLLLAPLAFAEELMVRGYALTVLRKSLDWRVAVGATSVVFGILHLGNPGANAASIGNVILAGVLLGTIVVVTESLYAATAAHLAWNWVMAGVLHVPVSGFGVATPDYRLVDAGPDWVTGGGWGPEGGLGAACGMGGALAYLYGRRARLREE